MTYRYENYEQVQQWFVLTCQAHQIHVNLTCLWTERTIDCFFNHVFREQQQPTMSDAQGQVPICYHWSWMIRQQICRISKTKLYWLKQVNHMLFRNIHLNYWLTIVNNRSSRLDSSSLITRRYEKHICVNKSPLIYLPKKDNCYSFHEESQIYVKEIFFAGPFLLHNVYLFLLYWISLWR